MAYKVNIEDDFDISRIARSGQVFRITELEDGSWRVVMLDKPLRIREVGPGSLEVSCSEHEWKETWSHYFDLSRDYSAIRMRCAGKNALADASMQDAAGLRLLRQDPWEMIVTFIVSQRKSMPAIRKCVESLCERFGRPIDAPWGNDQAFPTPESLASATEEEIRSCGLGYRAPYLQEAARMVLSGETDLDALSKLDDADLLDALMLIPGVGPKVSSCIALFGYSRTEAVPIDVWIARAIEEMGDSDPFSKFGEDAGIVQQYIFFHMTDRRGR